ncbi:hypothetical protein L6164_011807 [Bauhinia variegata]|uniref:Uncharacterized protein n=1 Tax=Bauhinia variegata TaxID=167791 RepID=A0ACB9PCE0_BAUVA|nr:hypothetical protein L6164_011807 [Bauhinia variegata]
MAEALRMPSFADIQAAAADFARGFDYNYYRPLHIAVLKGDWETAEKFFNDDPGALTSKITTLGMTPLHVAAVGSQWKIVEKLVQLMSSEALAVQDFVGCTALHYVATSGSLNAAKAMVTKNRSLTQIITLAGHTPLLFAITSTRSKQFVRYLAFTTTDDAPACPFSGPSANYLVTFLTAGGYHDITLDLIQLYPNLATMADEDGSYILNVLSQLPSDFPTGSKLGFLESIIYHFVPVELDHPPPSNRKEDLEDPHGTSSDHQCYFGSLIWKAIENLVTRIKIVRDRKLRHKSAVRLVEYLCSKASTNDNDSQFWQSFVSGSILSNATSFGIVEILSICLQFFPDLIWNYIPNEGYIMQIAIKNRQEKVFNLLCDMPISRTFVLALDDSLNTTTHLAARLGPPSQLGSISGTAFQMQRELQWFKEVEKLDHPLHKHAKNKDGKTPWDLFRDEHKGLLEEGEKWMKDTSNCCMLVSTLIATVVFSAGFTVPGGNDQEKGYPIFLNDNIFMVFAVSDALALFSSITSLFMFFSILTARYAEEDFLKTLPNRLILGLTFLFFAIATTMIAFGAALCLMLREGVKWVAIPVAFLAFLSIALFAVPQLPLFLQMVASTHGRGIYHPQRLW